MALGGSTNAVVHLPAIAGRAGVPLGLDDFDRFARTTPMVASIRPSGKYHMEDLAEAGGIPAVMKALAPLLHLDAPTVTGRTLGASLDDVPAPGAWQDVVTTLDRPFKAEGGLAILRGSLAPDGAVLKVSAATPALLRHRGPACVFRDLADLAARVDDPALPVTPDERPRAPERRARGRTRDARGRLAPDPEEAPRGRASGTWCACRTRG